MTVQLVCDFSVYGAISTKITYLQKITKSKNGTSHPHVIIKIGKKTDWQELSKTNGMGLCENHTQK